MPPQDVTIAQLPHKTLYERRVIRWTDYELSAEFVISLTIAFRL